MWGAIILSEGGREDVEVRRVIRAGKDRLGQKRKKATKTKEGSAEEGG